VSGVRVLNSRPILVTGATGYIGGRLVPRLLEAGYAVRCLARSPRKLTDRPWATDARVEILQGDLSNGEALVDALRGCGSVYYLAHSIASAGADYPTQDREMARRFAEAARIAGSARIICLGGLGELGAGLGEHLASRQEVERMLASSGAPVTVLRGALIIGSGSVSFEVLRYLVERLPVMVTPRWMSTPCQPIAVRNVLAYLVGCLSVPETEGLTLDIGGPEVVTYRDLMRIMAEELGLRHRIVIPVPVLAPRLSAFWIHLVTPIGHRLAAPLVEGLRNPAVCRDGEARRLMPQRLLTVREAIRLALVRVQQREVRTIWSAAGPIPGDPDWSGGTVLTEKRSVALDVPPAAVYRAVCRMGGANGWYAAGRLWSLRGALDRLVGGPGLRRGRRDPEDLSFGETVDFWRVIGLERNRLLILRAEMKVPGDAELEFAIEPQDDRGAPLSPEATDRAPRSHLTQTARFRPRGLAGHAYWYAMLPFHAVVFSRMLRGIKVTAEALARTARENTS
jgi:uncharacterized protein YbjT (DUF2867 family)